jgi:sulfite reductase alpha subunit-like flavoprotein
VYVTVLRNFGKNSNSFVDKMKKGVCGKLCYILLHFNNPPPESVVNIHIFHLFFQHKQIAIFYGSQTGTAEEFAGHLAKDAAKYGMKASMFDPEEFEMVCNDSFSIYE